MSVWLNDQFKRAAIRASRTIGGVRVELRSSGDSPLTIILQEEKAAALKGQLAEALQALEGAK